MLSTSQIRLIEADVRIAGITFSHLSDELVDHICCEVEQAIEAGKNFDEAYEVVKKQTGIETLQTIQEQTISLIHQKYKTMKTVTKISGNLSLVLLAGGILFRMLHLPGGSLLLAAGFMLIVLSFFPLAVFIDYREGKKGRQMLWHISALAGGICFMSGMLFKVMYWPGANILMMSGWLILLLVFLPILLYMKLSTATTPGERWVYICGAFGVGIFELASMFKVMHWPGTSILMLAGSFLLVSVFLPMYAVMQFRRSNRITGEFIFMIIATMYLVLLTTLVSVNKKPEHAVGSTPPAEYSSAHVPLSVQH